LAPLTVEPTPQTVSWKGGEVRNPSPGDSRLLVSYPGAAVNTKEDFALQIIKTMIDKKRFNFCHKVYKNTYSDAGVFSVRAATKEGTSAETYKAILSTVSGLRSASVADFEAAKLNTVLDNLHSGSDAFGLSSQIARYGRTDNAKEIGSVTFDEVKALADKLSKSDHVVIANGDVRGVSKF